MTNVVPDKGLLIGMLGLGAGTGLLVWVRPLLSVRMYDARLKQAGLNHPLILLWFRIIGGAQLIAFVAAGILALATGVAAIALYILGFFGLNPLHIAS